MVLLKFFYVFKLFLSLLMFAHNNMPYYICMYVYIPYYYIYIYYINYLPEF